MLQKRGMSLMLHILRILTVLRLMITLKMRNGFLGPPRLQFLYVLQKAIPRHGAWE